MALQQPSSSCVAPASPTSNHSNDKYSLDVHYDDLIPFGNGWHIFKDTSAGKTYMVDRRTQRRYKYVPSPPAL